MTGKWNDALLDRMRREGDELASSCYQALLHDPHGIAAVNLIFKSMSANADPPLLGAPRALKEFLDATRELPPGTNLARLRSGQEVFLTHGFPAVLALLTKSLPAGYAAPNLSRILNISGDLIRSPYRRLLGVLQMIVNVCAPRAFEGGGKAVLTAQQLRLLHEGVRYVARCRLPQFEGRYGVPVNHEDMVATILAFSYLVVEGLRTLQCGLSTREEEDYYYLWRVYARVMGIPGDRVPENLDDAAAFYAAYARRHYVPAAENPDGVALARANLRMLRQRIPRVLRWLGLGVAPRLYMRELLRPGEADDIGIAPVVGHRLLKAWLHLVMRLWLFIGEEIDHRERRAHAAFSRMVLQGLIDRGRDGEVQFTVPETLDDLRKLV